MVPGSANDMMMASQVPSYAVAMNILQKQGLLASEHDILQPEEPHSADQRLLTEPLMGADGATSLICAPDLRLYVGTTCQEGQGAQNEAIASLVGRRKIWGQNMEPATQYKPK